jgi:branched-chain amino acid transport system ATP-binding protein
MLEVERLNVFRGQAHVLKDVSLQVRKGELVTLLGPNGAGKTTLVESIFGLHTVRTGSIRLFGQDMAGRPTHEAACRGASCVPEGRRIFSEMTVEENLVLGAYAPRAREKLSETRRSVHALFPVLRERSGESAFRLSGGQQQMLAIGRALMARPELLLIDEFSAGLSPKAILETFAAVMKLREQGLTILLIEQNVELALKNCDRAYVLEAGEIVLEGSAAQLFGDERVRHAYLGL